MSLQTLLSEKLAEPSITALIDQRSYMTNLPQNPIYPAVRFRRVTEGQRQDTSGVNRARYQFDAYAKTYAEAHGISEALFAILEDWQTGGTTPAVQSTRRSNATDFHDDTSDLHIISSDYIFILSA